MRALIACSLVLGLLGFSSVSIGQSASTGPDRIGTFKQTEGEAWVGPVDTRRPSSPGDSVQLSDRLSTGKTGAAAVTLKDGTVITLGPNTTVDLNQFAFNTTTQEGNVLIELLQGSVRVVTGLLGKVNPELFKIKTPTSVVGVRGTDFIVETEAAK